MNDVIYAGTQPQQPHPRAGQHPSWEMFCCLEGGGKLLVEDAELPFHGGDVVVIPPDTDHLHMAEDAPGSGLPGSTARCIWLNMTDTGLAFRNPVVLQDDGNQSMRHLFADVRWHFAAGDLHRAALLPAYGQLIVQHISVRRSAAPRDLLVQDIAQSIMQNYANVNFELEDLLKSAPYCYDYLCRLFRQELHTTPHKYLVALRLEAAADHLRAGSNRSITEIARMSGFHDPLYFSRMFKKRYGVSPRAYVRAQPDAPSGS